MERMAEKKKKSLTFEQALEKLDKIVTRIEAGEVGLEASITQYEEGIALIRQCREILAKAEKKIEVLTRETSGELTAAECDENEPFTKGLAS